MMAFVVPFILPTSFLVFVIFQGCVGTPLPGTEVRIVTQNTDGKSEVIHQEQSHV